MSQTVTLRLPDATANWLKSSARKSGRSVNDIGATLMEEARRVSEFAEIEFRTFNGERHACIKGQLQIWQVIEVSQQFGMNAEQTAAYFGWPAWKAQAALNYYEMFAEEIDTAIEENQGGYERLKRLFPQMVLSEISTPPHLENSESGEAR